MHTFPEIVFLEAYQTTKHPQDGNGGKKKEDSSCSKLRKGKKGNRMALITQASTQHNETETNPVDTRMVENV